MSVRLVGWLLGRDRPTCAFRQFAFVSSSLAATGRCYSVDYLKNVGCFSNENVLWVLFGMGMYCERSFDRLIVRRIPVYHLRPCRGGAPIALASNVAAVSFN